MPINPHHAAIAANDWYHFSVTIGITATKAPIASSNARVCGEKNAHGWEESIMRIHNTNDTTVTTAESNPMRTRTFTRDVADAPMHRNAISNGHTK